MCKNQLKSYVPRHRRLGVCCGVREILETHELPEVVPILDSDGNVVYTRTIMKSVLAADNMSKYQLKHFRLSTLIENGVPLKMMNINSNSSSSIEQLVQICQDLDNADKYVERCLAQKAERDSWFKEFTGSDDNQVDDTQNVD